MALQGSLRDFPVAEILQLLGSQKKTGCLAVQAGGTRSPIYVQDGRIVSTREAGMATDDPLLRFLRDIQRLSEEQILGLESIQRESGRDLEDLLVNGRYLESQELAGYLERQILEDISRFTRWTDGNYQFDPQQRWNSAPLVRLSIEGSLIEVARRVDEQKRYEQRFRDPAALLVLQDFPDPSDPLSDEERELFGIIDGRHTVAEVVQAAPLTEFEATEALFRMLEAGWIETAGRRDESAPAPGGKAATPAILRPAPRSWGRELAFAGAVIVALVGLRLASRLFDRPAGPDAAADVYVAAQIRDLRFALDLYRRERGSYPERLDQLADDRFVESGALRVPGYVLRYRPVGSGADYALDLQPER